MTVEEVIKNDFAQDETDVKDLIDMSIQDIIEDEELTVEARCEKVSLYAKLRNQIEQNGLEAIEEDYTRYSLMFTGYELQVLKTVVTDVMLDETEEHVKCETAAEETVILSESCRFVALDEFAKIHHVLAETAERWFRSGVLKYIRNVNNEWLIASTCDWRGIFDNHIFVSDGTATFSANGIDFSGIRQVRILGMGNEGSGNYMIKATNNDNNEIVYSLPMENLGAFEYTILTSSGMKAEAPINKFFFPYRKSSAA